MRKEIALKTGEALGHHLENRPFDVGLVTAGREALERFFVSEESFCSMTRVAALKRQGRFVILAETVVTSGRKFREHSFFTLARLSARLVFLGPRGVRSRRGLEYWYESEREIEKL